jgi:ATP-binding cassette subfamily B protein
MVDAREEASNVLAGHVTDSIANMEAVRALAREEHEADVHRRNVDNYISLAKRSWDYQNLRVNMVTSPLYVLTNTLGLLVAIGVSNAGLLGAEAVFITFSYFASFTRVMWDFNNIYRNVETVLADAAQFTELLIDPPKVVDVPTAAPFAPVDGSVVFDNVRFRFQDREGEHLFAGLNLSMASGEKVGLVGHSGGGKTTVTRLLLRFMDIEGGQIRVGGRDIATVPQRDLAA